jgi:hypothetical protein
MGYEPPQVVEGQPRVGLPFGLFSVLSLRGASDPHWANGIEWEAMTCGPVSGISDPDCDTDIDKFFREMSQVGEATSFTVYGSAKCGAPGGGAFQKAEEAAQAHLLAREEAQAEAQVWARLAAQATDLNAAGALAPAEALALLEDWMGRVYGSLGAIHGSRAAVSILDTRVNASGSRLLTKVGTPVVAGAGYPGSSPAGAAHAAGETWVYASPALFGYRGQVSSYRTLDQTQNDVYALAERSYVVGFDPCGVAAVRMDLSG